MKNIFFNKSDAERWKYSYQALYFLATVNIVLGTISFIITSKLLSSLGGKYLPISGALFIICAIFVHKKKSSIALWIATIYWALEILLSFVSIFVLNNDVIVSGLFMKFFILYFLIGGIAPVKRLRKEGMIIKNQAETAIGTNIQDTASP